MNIFVSYFIQVAITFATVSLIARYVRPHLRKMLVDLCGTEARADFWTIFSNILLIGMPMIFALNYNPQYHDAGGLFFDVTSKLSSNLGGFLLALVCIGIIVSFFALVAPKQAKAESK